MENTPKPKSNRDKIVRAALEAFVETGFHLTGIRDIAKRAGVSLGNLYNHFAGKDDLIVEIARIEAVEIEELLVNLPTSEIALDGICALSAALLVQVSKPENAVLTADLTSEALRNPKIAEVFAANEARIQSALKTLIQRGIDDGELSPPVPVKDCATLIRDAAQATGMRAAFEGPTFVITALVTQEAMIKRLLLPG